MTVSSSTPSSPSTSPSSLPSSSSSTSPLLCHHGTTSTSTSPSTSSTSTHRPVPSSFHGRTLPPGLPALSSKDGTARFSRALAAGHATPFFSLVSGMSMQSSPALCGPASLAGALNALRVDPRRVWMHPWRWYVDDLLLRLCCTRDEEKKTGGSMNVEEEKKKKKKKESVLEMYVKKHGVTLDQLHCIAYCEATAISSPSIDHNNRKNVKVSIHRDMNETEVRHLLIDSVSSASLREEEDGATTIVIASYDRRVLGQSGSGHFSPVGAYDAVTDAVLVLDTAMFKYEAHWVPVSMLVEATKKVDESCGRTRGFLRVSVDGEEMKKKKTMMSSSSSSRSRVGGGGGRCEMCKDMLMMADSSNKNKTQERGVGQRLACCC